MPESRSNRVTEELSQCRLQRGDTKKTIMLINMITGKDKFILA